MAVHEDVEFMEEMLVALEVIVELLAIWSTLVKDVRHVA